MTILSACGSSSVSIDSPLDGSILDVGSSGINIQYSDEDTSNLIVELNGVNITDTLEIAATNATGTANELVGGLNVLKATLNGKTVISKFDYYMAGIPTNVTALYSDKAYDDAIKDRYNSLAHDQLLDLAKEYGYTSDISIPTEIVSEGSRILMAQLHDEGAPNTSKVFLLDTRADSAEGGYIDTATLNIFTGECALQVITETHSQSFDLCESPETTLLKRLLEKQDYNKVAEKCGNDSPCSPQVISYAKTVISSVNGCKVFYSPHCAGSAFSFTDALLVLGVCNSSNIDPNGAGSGGGGGCSPDPENPSNLRSFGEPHIMTMDDVRYENHLGGEFVLLREKSVAGLEIQTRQQIMVSGSFNAAVAMRLGEDVIEFRRLSQELLINGINQTLNEGDTLTLAGGSFILRNNGIWISTPEGNQIQALVSSSHLDIHIDLASTLSGNVEGLLGNFDGDKNNDRTLRNGGLTWDIAVFKEDWRLQQEESLFTYEEGQSTDTFYVPTVDPAAIEEAYLNEASDIYFEQCGESPSADSTLVTSIAIDLAAGMTVEDINVWFSTNCENGSVIAPVTSWNELYANFSGSWDTSYGYQINLTQNERNITGFYSSHPTLIEGTMTGNIFTGKALYDNGSDTPLLLFEMIITLSDDGLSFTEVRWADGWSTTSTHTGTKL